MAVAAKSNPNALLVAFRKYHTWFGVALTGVIVTVALTGIYLNHKDLFKGAKPEKGAAKAEAAPLLTTGTDLAALPVGFAQALAAAKDRFGDSPVEKIELKSENGKLVYRVESDAGELFVDAATGVPGGKPVVLREAKPTEWGKILKDIHTGKIGGLAGKLVVDVTAVGLVVLSGTGVYLWLIPVLRKRRSARQREQAAAAAAHQRDRVPAGV